jgi:thioesterase domain-containing protein
LHRLLVEVDLMPPRSEPDALRGPLSTFAAALRTRYRPQNSYPEALHLVLADDPKLNANNNRLHRARRVEGWQRWAPNLIYSHCPGNHVTMLRPPHVLVLARVYKSAEMSFLNLAEQKRTWVS